MEQNQDNSIVFIDEKSKKRIKKLTKKLLLPIALIICALIISLNFDKIHFSGGGGSGGSASAVIEATQDYMNFYGAREYLQISQSALSQLIKSGELDGTFVLFIEEREPYIEYSYDEETNVETSSIVQTHETDYIFSRIKLDEYMQKLIEAKTTIKVPYTTYSSQ